METPLLIMPAGWRRDVTVQRRDEDGHREEVTFQRRDEDGTIGGYELRPATSMATAGMQHATVCPPTVQVRLRASQFGLTVEQLRLVVLATGGRVNPTKARQGLHLPGGAHR